jgi:glycosyltransferase involved in cell wall biosynthesis
MFKISVIIPMYNRQDFIKETLISIENQQLKPLEVIVVDDKSTDDSVNEVKLYAEQSLLRIKVIENYKKKGVCGATNSGIENATGDFIALQDSDDLWTPNHLSQLSKVISEYPQVSIAFSGIEVFGNANDVLSKAKDFEESVTRCLALAFDYKGKGIYLSNKKLLSTLLQWGFPFRCPASLIRRSLFIKNNLFLDEDITYTQDSQFACMAAYYTPFIYNQRVGLRIRRHRENDGDKGYGEKIPNSYEARVIKLNKYFANKNLTKEEKKAFKRCLWQLQKNVMEMRTTNKRLTKKIKEGMNLVTRVPCKASLESFLRFILKAFLKKTIF